MKNKKIEIILIALLIVLQSVLFVYIGTTKKYLHMDESYSFALSNYHRVELQDNEDFYDNWHDGAYYQDYLALQQDEYSDFSPVYENQKNDVHPPFYYLLLRLTMYFTGGKVSMWPGIVLNIICYGFITLLSYLICQRLFKGQKHFKEKSAILAFLASVTMSSLSSIIYIRMYALSTLIIMLTAYLHIRLKEEQGNKAKWFVLIGVAALIGSLTHYYYLFYFVMLFGNQLYKYLRAAEFKLLGFYALTGVLAGGLSLLIFPYSIQHMFSGYRGEGFIEKLKDVPQFLNNFSAYAWKLNVSTFNTFLVVIGIFVAFVAAYKKNHPDKLRDVYIPDPLSKDILQSLYMPTTFYFCIVAIASPWIELRYIMPVCVLIFLLMFYYFHRLLASVFGENRGNVLVCTALVLMFVLVPYVKDLKPEFQYTEMEEVSDRIENELNVPAVYFLHMDDNRFMDNILLFAELEESYVTKNFEPTEENVKRIVDGKDLSEGMLVFVNFGNDYDAVFESVRGATGLQNVEHIHRFNNCDIYYVS